MSAIAEILAFVNSNTNETLDELIKRLDNKKEFVVGNYQLSSPMAKDLSSEGTEYNYFSFTPELSGNIKLNVSGNGTIRSDLFSFKVYKNDVLFRTLSAGDVTSQSFTIPIVANSTYKFTATRIDWASYQRISMQLFGDIKILGYYSTTNL